MAQPAPLHDHERAAERQVLDADATLRVGGRPVDALIANISTSGCLFVCADPLAVGDTLTIGIAGIGRRPARVVRALDTRYGAEFEVPLSPEDMEAAASAQREIVVPFPMTIVSPAADDDEVASAPALAVSTRMAIVAGLAVATWAVLIPVLHLVA
jgi:hypothetical protein